MQIRYVNRIGDEYYYAYDAKTGEVLLNKPLEGGQRLRIVFDDIADRFFFNGSYSLPHLDDVYQRGRDGGTVYHYSGIPGSLGDYYRYNQLLSAGTQFYMQSVLLRHTLQAPGNLGETLESYARDGYGFAKPVPPKYAFTSTWNDAISKYENNLTFSPFVWYSHGNLGLTNGDPNDPEYGVGAYGDVEVYWSAAGWDQSYFAKRIIDVTIMDHSLLQMTRGTGGSDQLSYPFSLEPVNLINSQEDARGVEYFRGTDYAYRDGNIEWEDGRGPSPGATYYVWPKMDSFLVILIAGDYVYRNGTILEDVPILLFQTKDKYGTGGTNQFQFFAPLENYTGVPIAVDEVLSLQSVGQSLVLVTNHTDNMEFFEWDLSDVGAFDSSLQRKGERLHMENLTVDLHYEVPSLASEVRYIQIEKARAKKQDSMWDILTPYIFVEFYNTTVACYYLYAGPSGTAEYVEVTHALNPVDEGTHIADSGIPKFFSVKEACEDLHERLVESHTAAVEGWYGLGRGGKDPVLFRNGSANAVGGDEFWFEHYRSAGGGNIVPALGPMKDPGLDYNNGILDKGGGAWTYPDLNITSSPKRTTQYGTYTDPLLHQGSGLSRVIESVQVTTHGFSSSPAKDGSEAWVIDTGPLTVDYGDPLPDVWISMKVKLNPDFIEQYYNEHALERSGIRAIKVIFSGMMDYQIAEGDNEYDPDSNYDRSYYMKSGLVFKTDYLGNGGWKSMEPRCQDFTTSNIKKMSVIQEFAQKFHKYAPSIPVDGIIKEEGNYYASIKVTPQWYRRTSTNPDQMRTEFKILWVNSSLNYPDINITLEYKKSFKPFGYKGEHLDYTADTYFPGDLQNPTRNMIEGGEFTRDYDLDGTIDKWEELGSGSEGKYDPVDHFHATHDSFKLLDRYLYVRDHNWGGDWNGADLLMHAPMDAASGFYITGDVEEEKESLLDKAVDFSGQLWESFKSTLFGGSVKEITLKKDDRVINAEIREHYPELFDYRYNEQCIAHPWASNPPEIRGAWGSIFDANHPDPFKWYPDKLLDSQHYDGDQKDFYDFWKKDPPVTDPQNLVDNQKYTDFYFNIPKGELSEAGTASVKDALVKFTLLLPFKPFGQKPFQYPHGNRLLGLVTINHDDFQKCDENIMRWDGWLEKPSVELITGSNNGDIDLSSLGIKYEQQTSSGYKSFSPLSQAPGNSKKAYVSFLSDTDQGSKEKGYNERVDIGIVLPSTGPYALSRQQAGNPYFSKGASWAGLPNESKPQATPPLPSNNSWTNALKSWSTGQEEVKVVLKELMKQRLNEFKGASNTIYPVKELNWKVVNANGLLPDDSYGPFEAVYDWGSKKYHLEDSGPFKAKWSNWCWWYLQNILYYCVGSKDNFDPEEESWMAKFLQATIPGRAEDYYQIGFRVRHGVYKITRFQKFWNGRYTPVGLSRLSVKKKTNHYEMLEVGYGISALDVVYDHKFGWKSHTDPDFIKNPLYQVEKWGAFTYRENPEFRALTGNGAPKKMKMTLAFDSLVEQLKNLGCSEGKQVKMADVVNDQKLTVKVAIPNFDEVKKVNITIGATFNALWATPDPKHDIKTRLTRETGLADAERNKWSYGAASLSISSPDGTLQKDLRYWIQDPSKDPSEEHDLPPPHYEIWEESAYNETTIELWTTDWNLKQYVEYDSDGTGFFLLTLRGGFNIVDPLVDEAGGWREGNVKNVFNMVQSYRYKFGFSWDYLDIAPAYRAGVMANFKDWGTGDEFFVVRQFPGDLALYSAALGPVVPLSDQGWGMKQSYTITCNQYRETGNYSWGIVWMFVDGEPYYLPYQDDDHQYTFSTSTTGTNGWFDQCVDLVPGGIPSDHFRASAIDNYLYLTDDDASQVEILKLPADPSLNFGASYVGSFPYPAGFTRIEGIDWYLGYMFLLDASGKIAVYDLGWSQIRFQNYPAEDVVLPLGSEEPVITGWEEWNFTVPEATSFEIEFGRMIFGYGWEVVTSPGPEEPWDYVLLLTDYHSIYLSHPGPHPDPRVWNWSYTFNWWIRGKNNNLLEASPCKVNLKYLDDDAESPEVYKTIVSPKSPHIGEPVKLSFLFSDKSGIGEAYITYPLGDKQVKLDVLFNPETNLYETVIPGVHVLHSGTFIYKLYVADADLDGAFKPDQSFRYLYQNFTVLRGEGLGLLKVDSPGRVKIPVRGEYSQKMFIDIPLQFEYPPGDVEILSLGITMGENAEVFRVYEGEELWAALNESEVTFRFPLVGEVQPQFQVFVVSVSYTVDGDEYFDRYVVYYYLSDPQRERAEVARAVAVAASISAVLLASSITVRRARAKRSWRRAMSDYWDKMLKRDEVIRKARGQKVPHAETFITDKRLLAADNVAKTKTLDRYGLFFKGGEV
ncbi:MAG: hypothetical protein ACTSU5_02775 [Promethearchaeota archaeon]